MLSQINDNEIYNAKTGILQTLIALSERDSVLYKQVIQEYLNLGEPFSIYPTYEIIVGLIQACGPEQALDIIECAKHPTKLIWLFGYYQALPSKYINPQTVENLCGVYQNAGKGELPRHYDYLLNYVSKEKSVIVRIVKIILDKASFEPDFARNLDGLFNPFTEVNKQLGTLFEPNQDILEKAYIAYTGVDKSGDFDGSTLSRILSMNPDFISEHIDRIYTDYQWPPRYDDTRDYSFLWRHDNCDSLMSRAIDRILHHERKCGDISGYYLQTLFCIDRNTVLPAEIINKQDEFLTGLIISQANDIDLMILVFGVISQFEEERRRRLIAFFLEHNKNYEHFKRLHLEPDTWSYWGSAVPTYKKRIEYWESLLPLCNSADLLQHKLHIENHIRSLRSWMEAEKKSDFMEDRF